MSASATVATASSSRSRPQGRKKANDDASYFGPSTSTAGGGTKRQAADKLDGEPRVKRKRVDASAVAQTSKKDTNDGEVRLSLVRLYRYPRFAQEVYVYRVLGRVQQNVNTCPAPLHDPVRHSSPNLSLPRSSRRSSGTTIARWSRKNRIQGSQSIDEPDPSQQAASRIQGEPHKELKNTGRRPPVSHSHPCRCR